MKQIREMRAEYSQVTRGLNIPISRNNWSTFDKFSLIPKRPINLVFISGVMWCSKSQATKNFINRFKRYGKRG